MEIGVLPLGEPGVFRALLVPEVADALADGEPVTALTLIQDDNAIGALAGYLDGGRFRIVSLYVVPNYRRCGGGRMLLEELFEALDGYAAGVEISFTVTHEDHRTLLSFLDVMGFEREEDNGETRYLTTLGKTAETSFFAASGNNTGIPFAELSAGAISLMGKAAVMARAPIPEGGLQAKTVDPDLSVAVFHGNNPEAYVVIENDRPGSLTLSAAWSGSKDRTLMPNLLRSAVSRACEKYPPETQIVIQAVNRASAMLIKTLLPDAEVISHTFYRPLKLWP